MYVVGFDPGVTTGFATFNHVEGRMPHLEEAGTMSDDLPGIWEFLEAFNEQLLVVYEGFNLHSHRAQSQIGSSFFTVKIIGVIDLWAELNETPVIVQTPAIGKSVWTDGKLKRFDYYNANKHSRDAIRHTLHALRVHRLPEVRELWND